MAIYTTGINVLLADDDDDDRLIFELATSELNMNINVEMACDGNQLMVFLHNKNKPLPDIIFLDLNMPRKNGIECLTEIRADERLKNLPVCIYSTSSSERDIQQTFAKGANVYVKKANEMATLSNILRYILVDPAQLGKQLNSDYFIEKIADSQIAVFHTAVSHQNIR